MQIGATLMTDTHNKLFGNCALSPETLMMGYGYDPFLSERYTSLLLSDETVSTVPSPLDSLLDSTGTSMATRQGEAIPRKGQNVKARTALRRTFPQSLGGEGEC